MSDNALRFQPAESSSRPHAPLKQLINMSEPANSLKSVSICQPTQQPALKSDANTGIISIGQVPAQGYTTFIAAQDGVPLTLLGSNLARDIVHT
jgi:hypothetical protein